MRTDSVLDSRRVYSETKYTALSCSCGGRNWRDLLVGPGILQISYDPAQSHQKNGKARALCLFSTIKVVRFVRTDIFFYKFRLLLWTTMVMLLVATSLLSLPDNLFSFVPVDKTVRDANSLPSATTLFHYFTALVLLPSRTICYFPKQLLVIFEWEMNLKLRWQQTSQIIRIPA